MAEDDEERRRLAHALKHAFGERVAAAEPARSVVPATVASKIAIEPPRCANAVRGSISFNAALLRAVLAGQKTQTRRPVRPAPARVVEGVPQLEDGSSIAPLAVAGERLWVRENWARRPEGGFAYAADGPTTLSVRWQPSRFMPREAARMFLSVRSIGVARLSSITDVDALAEGAAADGTATMFGPRAWFLSIWDAIYGETDFASARDPWVWVVEFDLVRAES